MKKFLEKNPVPFAVILIVIYVVGSSALKSVSESVFGVEYAAESVFAAALTIALLIIIGKNKLWNYVGLKKSEVPAVRMLFYVPLAVIALRAAFFGVGFDDATTLVVHLIMMFFVGFIEEIIFRGFLFKGIAKDSVTAAIIVSAVTFGIGHIVNLFNGSDIFGSVTQMIYAVAVGFMLVMIYVRTDSLIACIAFHSLNNMTTGFATGSFLTDKLGEQTAALVMLAAGVALAAGYTVYVMKCIPKREVNTSINS